MFGLIVQNPTQCIFYGEKKIEESNEPSFGKLRWAAHFQEYEFYTNLCNTSLLSLCVDLGSE